jgi:hypothetical protein
VPVLADHLVRVDRLAVLVCRLRHPRLAGRKARPPGEKKDEKRDNDG